MRRKELVPPYISSLSLRGSVMSRFLAPLLILMLLPFAGARAEVPPSYSPAAQPAQLAQQQPTGRQPNLISLSAGYVDFDKDEARTQSADFRLEHRWGYSLWSAQNNWLDFGIHPLAGFEFSTRSQLYGFGGFAFDVLMWKHLVFTESEAVGLFDSGDAKPLGSFIEFRSQAELGWRFDNDVRVMAQISHISNAGLTKRNPGEEIVGAYLHVPTYMLFGH